MSDLFSAETWRGELADLIQEHDLENLSGVDANMLSDLLSDIAEAVVDLIKNRDRGMPKALHAVERAELAALRRSVRLSEEVNANLLARLDTEQAKVEDLEVMLKDAKKQRDLTLETLEKKMEGGLALG